VYLNVFKCSNQNFIEFMRMPFFIDLSGKTILIIGGGREGAKRAEKYSKSGARIIVYSRSFDDKILELSRRDFIELVKGDVEDIGKLEEYIKLSDIIMVTLETEEYNDIIWNIAKKHKALINLANNAEKTDLVVPIDSSIGPFRVAITTEGKSSMVAREALQKVIEYLSREKELISLAEIMYKVKRIVRKSIANPDTRLKIYYEVFNNKNLRKALRSGDEYLVDEILRNILKEYGLEIGSCEEYE
jgi:precorrin-2 dehydrogenase / sirohydrochlorin ferrochelatase